VQSGIVVSAPNLSDWDCVPLRDILESKVGLPVAIENDVNLGALGESWRGTAQGEKNFVFLAIGTGVGAGIFVNGALYHGSGWAAGEIGYLQVPGTDGSPLDVHRAGSLESLIGGKGIERAWSKLAHRHRNHDRNSTKKSARSLQATTVFDLAESGEREARQVLDKSARILANAVTNISLILNSSLVVFGGSIGTHSALFEATRRLVERNEFARPRLAISSLGPDAQLYGAIWLAIKTAEAAALA
jgi:glucokinase